MKIGEIKLEALTLMNIVSESKLQVSNMSEYLNEYKYKKYLLNMENSINRAIDIINSQNVLKEKIIDLKSLNYELKKNYIVLTLNQISDYNKIKKVIKINDSIECLKYDVFSDKIFIYNINDFDKIHIVYYPKIIAFENLDDNDELNIPNELARLIPYFIKYDLYQEDEPNLSIMAKSIFDSLLQNYELNELGEESEIEKIFEV